MRHSEDPGGVNSVLTPRCQALYLRMYLTLNGLTPFLVQQRYDKIIESKFESLLSFTKKVQAHQLKTLHAPAVIEGVCFSADFKLCLCQDLSREIKVPPTTEFVS